MNISVLNSQKTIPKSRFVFVLMCLTFCGLYVAKDVLGFEISYYLIYAVAAITVLIVSKEEAIGFFMAISSFTGAGFDGTFCLIFFVCVLFRFIDTLGSIKLYSVLLLLMCLFETWHYAFGGTNEFGAYITYVMVLGALFIVQQYPHEKINKAFIVNTFLVFSLFFVMVTIVRLLIEHGSLAELLQQGFRTDEYAEIRDEEGLSANQNYLTQLCSVNMCLCSLMISKQYSKLPYIIATVIFVVCGMLTVSKMFIAVVVGYIVYLVFVTTRKNLKQGFALTIVLLLSVAVIFLLFGNTLIRMVMERFENEELTSGRITIIEQLIEYMNKYPDTYFWGTGILKVHTILEKGIHSSFFELLGGWGAIGLTLAGFYIGGLVKQAKRNAAAEGFKITGYNYLPLLMLLGYTVIGMLFGAAFSVVQIMVCIYAMQVREDVKNVV